MAVDPPDWTPKPGATEAWGRSLPEEDSLATYAARRSKAAVHGDGHNIAPHHSTQSSTAAKASSKNRCVFWSALSA